MEAPGPLGAPPNPDPSPRIGGKGTSLVVHSPFPPSRGKGWGLGGSQALRPRSLIALALCLFGCTAAPPRPAQPPPAPVIVADRSIITPDQGTLSGSSAAAASRRSCEEKWQDAADAFKTLLAAARVADDPAVPLYLLDLGLAEEGLGDCPHARDRYQELAQRFPASTDARTALLRIIAIDDYLEDWVGARRRRRCAPRAGPTS